MGYRVQEMDAWLGAGGWVVASSDRAARALEAAFHQARRSEGLKAWPAPRILGWNRFVRDAWEEHAADGRMVLSAAQEREIWAQVLHASGESAALLDGPRYRLAEMAKEAHALLAGYAARFLQKPSARSVWQGDAGVFSGWLGEFDARCNTENLVSESRIALDVLEWLKTHDAGREALLLVGFDRILPAQRALLDAWGNWKRAEDAEPAKHAAYHAAEDEQSEMEACAAWCEQRLAADPGARLLVVTDDSAQRRGAMERALLRSAGEETFEFSLGVPLSSVAVVRAALLILHLMSGSLAEHEMDWLLASGQTAANPEETTALLQAMRALRRRGLERTEWTLEAFIRQAQRTEAVPGAWAERMRRAKAKLAEGQKLRGPVEWAGVTPQILEVAGWPGDRALESAGVQALRRWEQALDEAASLGFDGRRVEWRDFLPVLARTVEGTLFAPESRNAPIQIVGPAESAGLTANGIWFLAASEERWPARGSAHPLLPLEIQRDAGMPHATAQLDWELAEAMTARLMRSAAEVHFSFARQNAKGEARPSRLVEQMAGAAGQMTRAAAADVDCTEKFEDWSRVPFPAAATEGGSNVLTSQSQCAFRAFAVNRLGAQGWTAADAGLTAAQRGQLLHAVLHSVWGGAPEGIRTQAELKQKLETLSEFVAAHVRRVIRSAVPEGVRERMPRRYLELEETRLTHLATEWLKYEATRWPFEVVRTEADSTAEIEGLTLRLRMDRVDRLLDETMLVVDYKTGDVNPKDWELPRPKDVQLPLYAGFALGHAEETLGGLVFAKVRAGKMTFVGRVGDAAATLIPTLSNRSGLVKTPLEAEELEDWRIEIRRLARGFLSGDAEVNPRDYPDTCERCELKALCRVEESGIAEAEKPDDLEGSDE